MYYGCLEDGSEVAVKMRSESSLHGLDEFLAEVPNFSHQNIKDIIESKLRMTHM